MELGRRVGVGIGVRVNQARAGVRVEGGVRVKVRAEGRAAVRVRAIHTYRDGREEHRCARLVAELPALQSGPGLGLGLGLGFGLGLERVRAREG